MAASAFKLARSHGAVLAGAFSMSTERRALGPTGAAARIATTDFGPNRIPGQPGRTVRATSTSAAAALSIRGRVDSGGYLAVKRAALHAR